MNIGKAVRPRFGFLVNKKLNVSVSLLGIDKWFPVIGTAIPSMQVMMTSMMKSKGVTSLEELRDFCIEAEFRMITC